MLRVRSTAGLAVAAALLTSLPYLLAIALPPPGTQFSGFLLNPLDGFSYLAKMRQGAELPLEFVLPYARDPGPGALLFVYHLLLGQLAQLTGAAPMTVYHLARIGGTLAMVASVSALFARAIATPSGWQAGLLLAIFGSGLGWLGIPLGLLASDLWVPEAIPLLSGYANAHFALATALLAAAVLVIAFEQQSPALRLVLSYGLGLGLALIQPFALLQVAGAAALWIAWEVLRVRELRAAYPQLSALVSLLAGAGPVLLYDWIATRVHPALAAWAAQNVTPTPGLAETLLGYGVVLPLVGIGVLSGRIQKRAEGRLLLSWAVIGLLLLIAPLPLQRRMALGVYIPLAGLAGWTLTSMLRTPRRQGLAIVAILAVSLPSHLVVVAAGLRSVAGGDRALILDDAEYSAYRWIAANLPAESVVLSGPRGGNRLPAFSAVRVVYGHPFETPEAEKTEHLMEELFGWSSGSGPALGQLTQLDVDFVMYGPEERALGQPAWLAELETERLAGDYQLYRILRR